MNNTITNLENIIENLEIEISEKQEYMNLIKNLNLSESITEEVWQKICSTSLRKNKEVMKTLAESTFPKAKDIVVGGNYVKFLLHDFSCYIPTDHYDGIEVYTGWYMKYEPKSFYEFTEHKSQKILDFLRIEHPSITDRVRFVCGKDISWIYAMYYYIRNRKRVRYNSNTKRLQENYEKWYADYQKYLDVYSNRYLGSLRIAEKMENELLPELREFTDNIRKATNGSYFCDSYSIQDITKWSHETSEDVVRSHILLLKTNKMFIDKVEE